MGRREPSRLEQVRAWYSTEHESGRWGSTAGIGLSAAEEALFDRHLTSPGSVLNIGCGGGREALALSSMGMEVFAVDLMPGFIRAAIDRIGADREVRFALADAVHLPFPGSSFDHVVMVGQLIGQITGRDNRLRCLREIRRVLRPRGLLIASTNNIEAGLRYRAYFACVGLLRGVWNPEGLEPGDARVFHVNGRLAIFMPRSMRPLYHWYRPGEFVRDLGDSGLETVEVLRGWEVERAPALSTETFYVARPRP